MLTNLFKFTILLNDAAEPWQLGFQDSAAPGFTGIVELHNTIFFYLILICVGVFWMLGSIMYFYNSKKSPIVHKYLNHGTNVPTHKYSIAPIAEQRQTEKNIIKVTINNKVTRGNGFLNKDKSLKILPFSLIKLNIYNKMLIIN